MGRKCVSGSQSGSARLEICFPACTRGDGNKLTALLIYYLIKHPLISKGPIFSSAKAFCLELWSSLTDNISFRCKDLHKFGFT